VAGAVVRAGVGAITVITVLIIGVMDRMEVMFDPPFTVEDVIIDRITIMVIIDMDIIVQPIAHGDIQL
jgi:hypothetical protein